ncbi:hypothetical protein XELAEV_18032605mg [Xenopus laevis]|uniref:Uncharacterized protein n=1 Tax=Xenopus laevis TaxID=8355 RepID=A0A974CI04_XENLA|nr:hypothetical protein XELAEV_18032605mg [Xenopus laevis]
MEEQFREYQRLEDFEEDSPPGEDDPLVHVPDSVKDSWHHIKNLDKFFAKISFPCGMCRGCWEFWEGGGKKESSASVDKQE